MEVQTTIQKLAAVLRGNAMVEISPFQQTPEWLNLGACSGLKVTEGITMGKEDDDNTESDENPSDQTLGIEFNLHEVLNSNAWDIMRGDFDKKTVIPDTAVTGAKQTFTGTSDGGLYELKGCNADGSAPTISGVVGTPTTGSPVTYDADDYDIIQHDGKWYFSPDSSGGNYVSTHSIEVTMSYTPAKSVKYQSGAGTTLPYFMMRLTTKNNGKPFYFVGYKGKLAKGKEISYPKDSDQDRRHKYPVSVSFKPDTIYHLDSSTGNGFLYETEGAYV